MKNCTQFLLTSSLGFLSTVVVLFKTILAQVVRHIHISKTSKVTVRFKILKDIKTLVTTLLTIVVISACQNSPAPQTPKEPEASLSDNFMKLKLSYRVLMNLKKLLTK